MTGARRSEAHFNRTINAPREARELVRTLVNGASPSFLEDALLLTSELVTNAVIHTKVSCGVVATYEPIDCLVVTVRDQSPIALEDRSTVESAATGSRGLELVDAVATSWGCNATAQGKEVWFELAE